jgi:hypothetical protein
MGRLRSLLLAGSVVWASVVCGAACGDSAPPGARPGPRKDAGADDASVDGDDGRGDAPVLPPADDTVTLPFGGPAVRYEFEVAADLGRLDVVFSIDTTGSFAGEIDNLQAEVTSRVIPGVRKRVPDSAFAVVRFSDFPLTPFGSLGDSTFQLLTPVVGNSAKVLAAVGKLDMPLDSGGDVPEAGAEALYQIATGEGYAFEGRTFIDAYGGNGANSAPGVGFRSGALRVVVHATDAPTHEGSDYAGELPGLHSTADALAALTEARVRVIGIASAARPRPWLEQVAEATGATAPPNLEGRCETGIGAATNAPTDGQCPLVFDVSPSGLGLSDTVVDAIVAAVNGVAFDRVAASAPDDRFAFVERIVPVRAESTGAPLPALIDEAAPFGEPEAFGAVRQGTTLVFGADLKNDSIRPMATDESFRVRIEVMGDGTLLASRTLRITVPGE